MVFWYSLNGGSTQSFIQPKPPVSRTVRIPGSWLTEGTTLDYAFEVTLKPNLDYVGPCTTVVGAVVPPRYGFHSVATAVADPSNSPYAEASVYAAAALLSQPQFNSSTSASTVCATYFASPTPCDVYTGQNIVNLPPLATVTPASLLYQRVAGTTSGPKTCMIYAPNGWVYRFGRPVAGVTGVGFNREDADTDSSNGRIFMDLTSAIDFFGSARAAWAGQSGFTVTFRNPEDPNDPGALAEVQLAREIRGQRSALAASAGASSSAFPKGWLKAYWDYGTDDSATPKGDVWSFRNDGPDVSGLGFAGLDGPIPTSAPEELRPGAVVWNPVFVYNNTVYRFWAWLELETSASTSGGGAMARVNVKNAQLRFFLETRYVSIRLLDDHVWRGGCDATA